MAFVIKYEWEDINNWIDLEELWESLIWFWDLFKKVSKIYKLKTPEIKVNTIKKWSVIVELIILVDNYKDLFSNNPEIALDFIKNTNLSLYNDIQNILIQPFNSEINSIWEKIEEYWRNNPVSTSLSLILLTDLFKSFIMSVRDYKVKNRKEELSKLRHDDFVRISENLQVEVNKLNDINKTLSNWWIKKLLTPLINQNAENMSIWLKWWEKISDNDLEDFISEWNEIFPNIVDWEIYEFKWHITAMQSNKWNTLTLKTNWTHSPYLDNGNQLFCCFVPSWLTTEDYKSYFWESKTVFIKLKAKRKSYYQKPKFDIVNIEEVDKPLFRTEN